MAGARGIYRSIYSALLDDPGYQLLSADARLALLTLRLGPEVGLAGIFTLYEPVLSARTGLPARRTAAALAELEAAGWIAREGLTCWVVNALRYEPSISLNNKKQVDGIVASLRALPKCALVRRFCIRYGIPLPPEFEASDTLSIPIPPPADTLSVGSRSGSGSGSGSGMTTSAASLPEGPPPGSPEFRKRWAIASERDRNQQARAAAALKRKPSELAGSHELIDEVLPPRDRRPA